VILGDIAVKGRGQRPIAYQAFLQKPDYVVVPGDIVYEEGRIPEYREVFYPVYNSDIAVPRMVARSCVAPSGSACWETTMWSRWKRSNAPTR